MDTIPHQQITKWLQDARYAFQDIPEQKKQAQLSFGIIVGKEKKPKTIIYTHKELPTRLIFQYEIKFAPQHQEMMAKMEKGKYNGFIVGLTDKMTTYDINWRFDGQEQKIDALVLTKYIDSSALSKDGFYQTLDRTSIVGGQMLRVINYSLGISTSTSSTGFDSTPSFYG